MPSYAGYKKITNKGAFCPNHPENEAYIKGMCRSCYEKWRRSQYPQTHEKAKARMREWSKINQRERSIKDRYHLSLDEFNQMLDSQGNKCAICDEIMTKINVDHDHTTQKVRGLLCSNCNFAIGLFKENISNLISAASYIQKHQSSEKLPSAQ